MGTELLIRDGDPHWYFSTDIWAVPGADPTGPAGAPVAGQPAYLWTRVENTGDYDATAVRVDFYWANPSLQVTRTNATLVGSAFVDVPAAGGPRTVLCLVPWVPVIVNDGHECLIAVANHPADPLPSPLPDAFDPPTYRQVAQRNLTVVNTESRVLVLTVAGLPRLDRTVTLTTEVGGEPGEEALASLGLEGLRPATDTRVEVGFRPRPACAERDEPVGEDELELHVAAGTSVAAYVQVRAPDLSEGEYQFVHIVERDQDGVVGGIGLVVVHADEGAR